MKNKWQPGDLGYFKYSKKVEEILNEWKDIYDLCCGLKFLFIRRNKISCYILVKNRLIRLDFKWIVFMCLKIENNEFKI